MLCHSVVTSYNLFEKLLHVSNETCRVLLRLRPFEIFHTIMHFCIFNKTIPV